MIGLKERLKDLRSSVEGFRKTIDIKGKSYDVIFPKEMIWEDINLYDGVLVSEVDRSEFFYFKNRYKPPVAGYGIRLVVLLYDSTLLVKDFRKRACRIFEISSCDRGFLGEFLEGLKSVLIDPSEQNLSKITLL